MTEFSVLLPVYAGDVPSHFERAVASVTAEQTLKPSEIVIVRDGPVSPELEDVITRTEDGTLTGGVPATVVRMERNEGLARALERGIAACAHEIVARADADDISLPQRFSLQVPAVAAGLDMLGSAVTEFYDDDESRLGAVRLLPLDHEEIAEVSRVRDPFNHPSVVYRKSAVAAAGGYEDLNKMEDYWLFARMIHNGARTANLPDSLVLYRQGNAAYQRRGGREMLMSELGLQRRLLALGFISPVRAGLNLAVRGAYRLIPTGVRRSLYQRFVLDRMGSAG